MNKIVVQVGERLVARLACNGLFAGVHRRLWTIDPKPDSPWREIRTLEEQRVMRQAVKHLDGHQHLPTRPNYVFIPTCIKPIPGRANMKSQAAGCRNNSLFSNRFGSIFQLTSGVLCRPARSA
ncbi:MAG: hypothetical protein HY238_25095 [Acidobacteria bacterium]|nr:hypothetical protein [Acidobacteriota bacterium]